MSLTPEQLEIRKFRLGASEVGALLGIDPYKTALDLFTGRLYPEKQEGPPHARWGLDVERPILTFCSRARRWHLLGTPKTMVDDRFPALCSSPDDLTEESKRTVTLDAKNVFWMNADEWGEPGTADVPLLYGAQKHVQIALASSIGGADYGYLCASIGGSPPDVWRVQFDPEVFGVINQQAEKFVRDHLRTGKPPTGWERDRSALEYVQRRYKVTDEALAKPTLESLELLGAIRAAELLLAEAEADKAAALAQLSELVGHQRGIEGIAKWVDVAARVENVTNWQLVAQKLALDLCEAYGKTSLDDPKFKEWLREVVDSFTEKGKVVAKGYRYLYLARPPKAKKPKTEQLPQSPVHAGELPAPAGVKP